MERALEVLLAEGVNALETAPDIDNRAAWLVVIDELRALREISPIYSNPHGGENASGVRFDDGRLFWWSGVKTGGASHQSLGNFFGRGPHMGSMHREERGAVANAIRQRLLADAPEFCRRLAEAGIRVAPAEPPSVDR